MGLNNWTDADWAEAAARARAKEVVPASTTGPKQPTPASGNPLASGPAASESKKEQRNG